VVVGHDRAEGTADTAAGPAGDGPAAAGDQHRTTSGSQAGWCAVSGQARRWAAAGACLATLFVGFTAFRLAYNGSRGAAIDAGLKPGDAAWYPLCIEGVLCVAAIGTVVLGGRLPWAVLITFSGLSVGANVIHAQDHGRGGWFSLLVAAVPPAALPLCVELTIRTVRKLAEPSDRATRLTGPVPDPVSEADQTGQSGDPTIRPDPDSTGPTRQPDPPADIDPAESGRGSRSGGRRSADRVRAEVVRLIDAGALPDRPTADAIRRAAACSSATARSVRDALRAAVPAGSGSDHGGTEVGR
jgi:hypothetical protein